MQAVVSDIVIDEKFKSLLPALDSVTLESLEANLLENGCRDSLVLWGDILIDGHNRYAICIKHDIPFNTVNKDFDSREDAMIWIITTQVSRRNLNATQLCRFRGLHYEAEKKRWGGNSRNSDESSRGQNVLLKNGVNDTAVNSTAKKIAQLYKINEKTVRRDEKIAKGIERVSEISPEAERIISSEEIKIDKKVLAALLSLTEEEIEDFASAVESGTYKKPKPEPKAPEDNGGSSASAFPGDPALPGGYAMKDGPGGSDSLNPNESPATPLSDAIIRYVANGVYTDLHEHSRNDTQVLKAALRSCIDILEGMYKSLSLSL